MTLLKSIGAIVAGFVTVVILSVLTDAICHALGIIPNGPVYVTLPLAIALAYRTVYTVIGGYVTAKLAPHHAMRHVTILACIGLAAGVTGAITMDDLGAPWYAWSVALESIPCVWFGGWLANRK